MRNLHIGLGLVLAFGAGCVAAHAAPFVIPPARAANVQRWEYLCFFRQDGADEIRTNLYNAGLQGWELSGGVVNGSTCMKRPLP